MSPTNTFKPSNRSAATAGRQSERTYRPLTRSPARIGQAHAVAPIEHPTSGDGDCGKDSIALLRLFREHLGRIVIVNIDTGGASQRRTASGVP